MCGIRRKRDYIVRNISTAYSMMYECNLDQACNTRGATAAVPPVADPPVYIGFDVPTSVPWSSRGTQLGLGVPSRQVHCTAPSSDSRPTRHTVMNG